MPERIQMHDSKCELGNGVRGAILGGNTLKLSGIKKTGIEGDFSYRVEFEDFKALGRFLVLGADRIIKDGIGGKDKTDRAKIQKYLDDHGIAAGKGHTLTRSTDELGSEIRAQAGTRKNLKKYRTNHPDEAHLKDSVIVDIIIDKNRAKVTALAKTALKNRAAESMDL